VKNVIEDELLAILLDGWKKRLGRLYFMLYLANARGRRNIIPRFSLSNLIFPLPSPPHPQLTIVHHTAPKFVVEFWSSFGFVNEPLQRPKLLLAETAVKSCRCLYSNGHSDR
jgi:hypothetical protein